MTTKIPPYIYMEILNYKEKSFLGSIPSVRQCFRSLWSWENSQCRMSSSCCSSSIGASKIIPELPCMYGDRGIEVVPGMSALGICGVCGIVFTPAHSLISLRLERCSRISGGYEHTMVDLGALSFRFRGRTLSACDRGYCVYISSGIQVRNWW